MIKCLCVAAGGAVGSVLRYLVGLIKIAEPFAFPVKTLTINLLGSFLIGLIAAAAGSRTELDPNLLLLLKVGLCGGFTTFSTFALDTAELLRNGKTVAAVAYIVLSVLLSVAAVFAADALIKTWTGFIEKVIDKFITIVYTFYKLRFFRIFRKNSLIRSSGRYFSVTKIQFPA